MPLPTDETRRQVEEHLTAIKALFGPGSTARLEISYYNSAGELSEGMGGWYVQHFQDRALYKPFDDPPPDDGG